ncbi:MAG: fructose-bisphosphatase class II, partial [Alphaproteobacteria bacterium]
RAAGAAIRLIRDGDIAGVIEAAKTAETGIDMYIGIGGAAEGVLAAAALRSIGGQFLGRLTPLNDEQRRRAAAMGITDLKQIYTLEDMVCGDVIFAATGITDGTMLDGVKFNGRCVETHSVVMRSASKTVRRVHSSYDIAASAIASA